jgi:hypothetical protein
MSYNGWKNKETWLVNLWLGDWLTCEQEEGQEISAEYVREMVNEMASAAGESDMNGLITDLLNCAIGEIDWHEIASHYQTEERESATG